MATVVADPAGLPAGSHTVSFYSGPTEAEEQALRFLSGAAPGTGVHFWVDRPEVAKEYNERLADVASARVGCVAALGHEQVEPVDGKLRPVLEVLGFLAGHPEGVTAGGDTISSHWTAPTVEAHLEYENWFEEQPRENSRFLCPYDLRRVPRENAPDVLHELGRHHSHVVLSSSSEPAVRLLQLFIFGTPDKLPDQLEDELRWAVESGFVRATEPNAALWLTDSGRRVVREWGGRTTVHW
jgi:hypothetical protein